MQKLAGTTSYSEGETKKAGAVASADADLGRVGAEGMDLGSTAQPNAFDPPKYPTDIPIHKPPSSTLPATVSASERAADCIARIDKGNLR